jgi:uncharacterized protein YbjT (DUF2867 family)
MSEKRTVLVAGATGQQGGAVVDALLARGHGVRALTRRPDSPAAKALTARGVEVFAADLEDASSVVAAAKGASSAFLMGNFYEIGEEGEVRQGIAAANAIKAAGVGHLIYSSVASANRATGIAHFDSKFRVEQHIAGLGIPYSISAPVAFMENVVSPWSLGTLLGGKLAFGLPPQRVNQLIGLTDIGAFVASLVERREAVFGKRFDIASDQLDGETQAAILSRASGRPIRFEQVPLAVLRQQNAELATMLEWFDRVGYDADIAGLRRDFTDVPWQTFAQWAETIDWQVLEKSAASAGQR